MQLNVRTYENLIKKYQKSKTRINKERLKKFTNEVTREVNKRMKELRKNGYAYGAYTYAANYAHIAYGTNRFKWAGSFDDIEDSIEQTRVGLTFLKKKSSTVQGQRETEKLRFDTIHTKYSETIGKESDETILAFLKYIGEHELASYFIDQYGNSDVALIYVFDAWKNHQGNLSQLDDAFEQFAMGTTGLYETLNNLGIDYTSKRYSGYDWRSYKY